MTDQMGRVSSHLRWRFRQVKQPVRLRVCAFLVRDLPSWAGSAVPSAVIATHETTVVPACNCPYSETWFVMEGVGGSAMLVLGRCGWTK